MSAVAANEISFGTESLALYPFHASNIIGIPGQMEPEKPFLGKRVHTYTAEYKRLPVFKFGLGKRLAQILSNEVALSLCLMR